MGQREDASKQVDIRASRVNSKSRWTNEMEETLYEVPADTRALDLRGQRIRTIELQPVCDLPNLERIQLGFNELFAIDLSPLAQCGSLTELDLGMTRHSGYIGNKIEQIDFTPLSGCRNLQRISLSGNQLQLVNLGPLSECKRLQDIDLCRNPLREIDLTPLSASTSLRRVDLGYCTLERIKLFESESLQMLNLECNHLVSINLEKLGACTALTHLRISGNPLEALDVWPIISNPNIDLGDEVFFYQDLVLRSLGFPELFGYDGDILGIMREASVNTDRALWAHQVYEILVSRLDNQIRSNGPTVFLGIERLSEGSALNLVPLVVKRRRQEVSNTTVLVTGDVVDLRPLWVTEYGFRVLTSLGADLEISIDKLIGVQNAMAAIGIELAVTKDPSEQRWSVNISERMKRYIFSLAHHSREREVQLRNPNLST